MQLVPAADASGGGDDRVSERVSGPVVQHGRIWFGGFPGSGVTAEPWSETRRVLFIKH